MNHDPVLSVKVCLFQLYSGATFLSLRIDFSVLLGTIVLYCL